MAKTKLKNLEVQEVSLVDAGANQHAKVALFKNREGGPQTETAKDVGGSDGNAAGPVGKAETFSQMADRETKYKAASQIGDACDALRESLASILFDEEAVDKSGLMSQSLEEFMEAVKSMVPSWASGTPVMSIAKTSDGSASEPSDAEKAGSSDEEGGMTDMKFNEASMTPAERMAFEDLKKRYGIDEPENASGTDGKDGAGAVQQEMGKAAEQQTPAAVTGTVEKAVQPAEISAAQAPAASPAPAAAAQVPAADSQEDIYKGLNPIVKAEIEALKKRAAEADHREMVEVAKKYQLLGKNPEELAKTLEGLKKAGGTAYDDMIATLDAAVSMVNTSGVFGEIGKRGAYGSGGEDTLAKIAKHAEKIKEAAPQISYAEAMDRAWAMHPELVEEYENSRK